METPRLVITLISEETDEKPQYLVSGTADGEKYEFGEEELFLLRGIDADHLDRASVRRRDGEESASGARRLRGIAGLPNGTRDARLVSPESLRGGHDERRRS